MHKPSLARFLAGECFALLLGAAGSPADWMLFTACNTGTNVLLSTGGG